MGGGLKNEIGFITIILDITKITKPTTTYSSTFI